MICDTNCHLAIQRPSSDGPDSTRIPEIETTPDPKIDRQTPIENQTDELKVGTFRRSREGYAIADIRHAGDELHGSFESQTETTMGNRSVLA